VTAKFSPNPVTATGNSTLTFSANPQAKTGNYTVTINGTNSGGFNHSAKLTLTVQ
jgi:hypothetical protein